MRDTPPEITPDELRVIADLTAKLIELRQNECKHLSINDSAPDLFERLIGKLMMYKLGYLPAEAIMGDLSPD